MMHAFSAPDDFMSVRVKTCGELNSAFEKISKENVGALIEVITPKMDTHKFFEKF